MKEIRVIYEPDDEEICNFKISELVNKNNECDWCGKEGDVKVVIRGDDGNIYNLCLSCAEKF
jgi:CRISPR/Cas system-associated protein Cas10 (large subunit of type III CRISPR-Cas system)